MGNDKEETISMNTDHRQKGDSGGKKKCTDHVSKGNRISGKSGLVKHKDSLKDKWMPGQMDRQLSLYSLMYVLLKGNSLSSWLKISFDPPLLLYSGEKTPFTCAKQDGGA